MVNLSEAVRRNSVIWYVNKRELFCSVFPEKSQRWTGVSVEGPQSLASRTKAEPHAPLSQLLKYAYRGFILKSYFLFHLTFFSSKESEYPIFPNSSCFKII